MNEPTKEQEEEISAYIRELIQKFGIRCKHHPMDFDEEPSDFQKECLKKGWK